MPRTSYGLPRQNNQSIRLLQTGECSTFSSELVLAAWPDEEFSVTSFGRVNGQEIRSGWVRKYLPPLWASADYFCN